MSSFTWNIFNNLLQQSFNRDGFSNGKSVSRLDEETGSLNFILGIIEERG